MIVYTAFASVNGYLLVAAFDQCEDDRIECLGWTKDNFPTPESFEAFDELLAARDYERVGPWSEDIRNEFSAPVVRV